MSPKQAFAGPLEIKILRILEEKGELPVAGVQTELEKNGEVLAYTTVMTVLGRLYEKSYLSRTKVGRQYIYRSSQGKKGIFSKLKKTFFGEGRLRPILSLLDADCELTLEELKTLRAAVNQRIKNEEGGETK